MPLDPRLGRYQTDKIDQAVATASGASQATAEQQAMQDNRTRYETPSKPSGEPSEPRGILDSIKGLLGIDREEPPEEDERKSRFRSAAAGVGSNIGSLMLASPGAEKAYAQAAQSKNPAAMLGMLAAQTTLRTRETMIGKGIPLDEEIWTAENGVLDNLLGEVMSNAKAFTGYEPSDDDIAYAYKAALQVLSDSDKAEGSAKGVA